MTDLELYLQIFDQTMFPINRYKKRALGPMRGEASLLFKLNHAKCGRTEKQRR